MPRRREKQNNGLFCYSVFKYDREENKINRYLEGIDELAPEVFPRDLINVVEWLHDILPGGGGEGRKINVNNGSPIRRCVSVPTKECRNMNPPIPWGARRSVHPQRN